MLRPMLARLVARRTSIATAVQGISLGTTWLMLWAGQRVRL